MSNWEKYEQAAERGPFSIFIKILLLVVGISIVIGVVGFVAYPFIQARRVYENIVRSMRDPGLLEYMDCRLLRMRVFPVGNLKRSMKSSPCTS